MRFYILLPGDTEDDTILDTNQLGEVRWGNKFSKNLGFEVLSRIVESNSKLVTSNKVRIFNDENRQFTIEEFLDFIEKYTIY